MSLEKSFKNCLEHLQHILFHIKSQRNTLNEEKNKTKIIYLFIVTYKLSWNMAIFFQVKKPIKNLKPNVYYTLV